MKGEVMSDPLGDLKNQLTSFIDKAMNQQGNIKLEITKFNKNLDHLDALFLKDAQKATGLPRWAILSGLFASLLVITVLSFQIRFLGRFVSNVIGMAYPTYMSVKAIETLDNTEDDTLWLTYWVVYSAFFVAEMFVFQPSAFLSNAARVYFLLKVVMLLWMQFGNGSALLYQFGVKPVVKTIKMINVQVDAQLEQYEEYSSERYAKKINLEDDLTSADSVY